MDDHLVHTSLPIRMFFQKLFLRIILANKWLVWHLITSPNQQRRPLLLTLWVQLTPGHWTLDRWLIGSSAARLLRTLSRVRIKYLSMIRVRCGVVMSSHKSKISQGFGQCPGQWGDLFLLKQKDVALTASMGCPNFEFSWSKC